MLSSRVLIIYVSKELTTCILIKDLWENSRCEEQVQMFHFYLFGEFDILLDSLTLEAEVGTLLRRVGNTMLFIATVRRN
jgi:hypothetical protein